MPLPKEALVVHGGCNCGAVRYQISIPELSQRPRHPYNTAAALTTADENEPVRLPMVVACHCNDCRRATGQLLPIFICAPLDFVTVSLVPRSSALTEPDAVKRKAAPPEPRGPWLPAAEVFTPAPAPANVDSFLSLYNSSHLRTRSFCGRCGTYLGYAVVPMPAGWPDMLDLSLGSVDRADLDGDALVPERQVWWDYGVDWIRKLSTEGLAVPIHATVRVGDDIRTEAQKQAPGSSRG
jgi:hypothetical protein